MDRVVHLDYLETVLKEFNTAATPNEELLICHFRNNFRPSIWDQADKWGQDLDS